MERKTRRPNKSLTLEEKVEVIQRYKFIRNTRDLARMFNCGRTQIQNILHRADEYIAAWKSDEPERILCVQPARMQTLGAMVWEWFNRCKNQNLIVSDENIFQVAAKAAKILHIRHFRPTKTWLDRLKLKYKFLSDKSATEWKCFDKKSLNIEDIAKDFKVSMMKPSVTRDPFSDVPFESVPDDECRKSSDLPENMKSISEFELIKNTADGPILYNISFDVKDEEHKQEEDAEKSTSSSSDGIGNLEKDKNQHYKLPTVVDSYKQALNHLGPLEQFALAHEDIRAVGLINQLENLFRERMSFQ